MFVHHLSPVLLTLGPVQIRWYGLIYAIGFVIALFMMPWLAKLRGHKEINEELVQEFIVYLILSVVVGARLFYVLFYNFPYYMANPLEILMLWKGGLSFHGGFLGAVVMSYLFCKKKKLSFYRLADITVIPLALGLALGRIANFINGELWGRVTNVPWAVKFPGAEGYRHPSQLYESAKNFVIFFILFFNRKKNFADGFLFWCFVFFYGVFRFLIEFFREPDFQVGYIFGFTMGQMLCAVMIIVSIPFLLRYKKKHKNTIWQLFKV